MNYMSAVSLSELFECGQAALDHLGRDAVSDADEALAAEGVRRHKQQLEVAGLLAECICIGLQGLYPEIECAVRIDAAVAVFGEGIVEQIAVSAVNREIGGFSDIFRNDALSEARCADEAQPPGLF